MTAWPRSIVCLLLFVAAAAVQADATPTATEGAPRVTYVANEGFLLEHGGKKALIDALFDESFGRFAVPPPELLSEITQGRGPFAAVDLLLITHPHADHFNPKLVTAYLRSNPQCQLIAHKETVDLLRDQEGFAQIRDRIREVRLEPGEHERLTANGIEVGILALAHPEDQVRNLAFVVNLGGIRFLHLGDTNVEGSLAHLDAFPFDATPVDVLLVSYWNRSPAARQLIGRKIKPSRIIAMHILPAKLPEQATETLKAYPWAIVFGKSGEQRSLPIEADYHHLAGDYLGQPEPGSTPQVFARGIVSTDLQEHGAPAFSPDGDVVVWSSNRKPGPDNEDWIGSVVEMRRDNGRWSAPYVPSYARPPAFSPDGRRGYFHAPRPGEAQETQPNSDIWFIEKQGDGWSEPECLGLVTRYPELRFAYSPTIARNGTLYFTGYAPGTLNDYGIYRAELVNGEYGKPELLPRSINLPPFLNWTPFIAPDESFLLFSSNRTGSLDNYGDLYVSRRLAGGSWTDPVSLGKPVNTEAQERIAAVSSDGKYLFFSRQTPDHDEDVFWVETAAIPALPPTTPPSPEKSE